MPILTLTVNNALVQFTALSRRDAVGRFIVWLHVIPPHAWNIAIVSGLGAVDALCFTHLAGINGPPQDQWIVTTISGSTEWAVINSFTNSRDALYHFATMLPRDGDHWITELD